MRIVADLSNFDNSLMEITTGESGEYASPYYRDQFPEWFAGRGIAAPFTDSAEDAVRAHRLLLLPPGGTVAALAVLLVPKLHEATVAIPRRALECCLRQ